MAASTNFMASLIKAFRKNPEPRFVAYRTKPESIEELKQSTTYDKKVLFLKLTAAKHLPPEIALLRKYTDIEVNLLTPIITGGSSDLSEWENWRENAGKALMPKSRRDAAWTAFSISRKTPSK
jgi:hypothetical protein